MKTPIFDFLNEYRKKSPERFHMPGHKGAENLLCEEYDITEIDGADSLFNATGVIFESEKLASEIFGAHTLYSTEGSSLSIRAMLYLAALHAKESGKRPLILAGRNAHKSFISAAALIDFDVEWIYPEKDASYLSAKIDTEWLKARFASKNAAPTALYITSPDYLGNVEDIRSLAEICHENGALLLVDNAHGAYLKFLNPSRHPIDLGADISCDSAHKTLHALTGSAYLHLSRHLPEYFFQRAKRAMSLFATTSPSYLILASLDKLNERLEGYEASLSEFLPKLSALRARLSALGFEFLGNEPLKLCFAAKKYGYFGFELARALIEKNIYPEFYDSDFLVLMLTPDNSVRALEYLFSVLSRIERKPEISENAPKFFSPVCKISPREAVFSPFEMLEAKDTVGKILAHPGVSCPPAVPILVPGEVIDKNALSVFEYYGIEKLPVVKEV